MIGAQASKQQYDKILSYIDIAKNEGGKIVVGGEPAQRGDEVQNGFYLQPTLITGNNSMRFFREEIFGPVIGVTTFRMRPKPGAGQRHRVRHGRRAVDPRHQPCLPYGPRYQSGPRVDQLLPPVPGARRVRRLQELRYRARNPQGGAVALSAGENLLVSYDAKPLGLF